MRGKLAAGLELGFDIRIIPAHAGQTRRFHALDRKRADHPRACGANVQGTVILRAPTGSSPRMRGKRVLHHRAEIAKRIIPAHAGQTKSPSLALDPSSDHPRACGANVADYLSPRFRHGSSPRMRGKHASALALTAPVRIIPAHAGQTAHATGTARSKTDHPRACGANSLASLATCGVTGSSPRMRGKLVAAVRRVQLRRIIPAHAGQTHP